MAIKERIIEISDKILNYLLEYKKEHPDFTFSLRSRDSTTSKEKRLKSGIWFQGTSNYLFVPLFKRGDLTRIKTIGFVIYFNSDGSIKSNAIEFSFKADIFKHDELDFHRELAKKLGVKLNEKNIGVMQFENKNDYLSNLKEYIEEIRPVALNLLKKYGIEQDYIIPEKEFQKNLDRIKKIKAKLAALTTQHDPIKELIKRYKKQIKQVGLKDEKFKWELLAKYKDKPDLAAPDFKSEMLNIDYSILVFGFGAGVTKKLAKEKTAEYKKCFEVLFDEDKELQERISFFNKETLKLYRELEPDTKKSHHQDERTMATFLTYHNPQKYTFYKDSFYSKLCKLTGEKPKPPGKKYMHYLKIIDGIIKNYIEPDKELLELIDAELSDVDFKDPNHKLLAQDIIYQTLDMEIQKPVDDSFQKVLSKFSQEKLEPYFNLLCRTIQKLKLEKGSDKLVFSLTDNNLNFIVGQRYCINLYSKHKKELYGIISKEKLSEEYEVFDGKPPLPYYNYLNNINFSSTEEELIYKAIEAEFSKTGKSSFRKNNDTAFESYVFELCKNYNTMNIPLNQILYGPPGTGKTFTTVNKALEIINPSFDTKQERAIVKEEFDKYVKSGRIVFTTFHQSMSYEDFVEGIKPVPPKEEGKPVVYNVQDGIFKISCINALFNIFQKEQNEAVSKAGYFDGLYRQFTGYLQEKIDDKGEYKFFTLKKKWPLRVTKITDDGNIVLEHLKNGENNNWEESVKTPAKLKLIFDAYKKVEDIKQAKDLANIGIHSWRSGYLALFKELKDFEKDGYKTERRRTKFRYEQKKELIEDYTPANKVGDPFVLIIDEINRGNVSQIFGELITLIEKDKRQGNNEALEITLPYSKKKFGVPSNLYIIGTMNTADRSVEALDTALRRRFTFEEMSPKPDIIKEHGEATEGIIKINGYLVDLENLLKVINERIEILLDRDHLIGHSYFMNVKDRKGLQEAFSKQIIPLLQEYFYGDYGKISLVIGEGFCSGIKPANVSDVFAAVPDYDVDSYSDKIIYTITDPVKMDAGTFESALKKLLKIADTIPE